MSATPKQVNVGDRIKDNDPRMSWRRTLEVVEVRPFGVLARDGSGRTFSILSRRIHIDGKPRRSGFDLLPSEGEAN